ncbi:hypothetical protein HKX48_006735 [Thoreauomyces humboldtii]|nr:hypothetical protein HKX48_006735 [Thoreauomyces humboldtii]
MGTNEKVAGGDGVLAESVWEATTGTAWDGGKPGETVEAELGAEVRVDATAEVEVLVMEVGTDGKTTFELADGLAANWTAIVELAELPINVEKVTVELETGGCDTNWTAVPVALEVDNALLLTVGKADEEKIKLEDFVDALADAVINEELVLAVLAVVAVEAVRGEADVEVAGRDDALEDVVPAAAVAFEAVIAVEVDEAVEVEA